jgi:two-component system, chemotaxis family, chemotaxis protein CheY
MASERAVLDVGNCGYDHGRLSRWLETLGSVRVVRAHSSHDALAAIERQPFDLVIANRILEGDGSRGLDLLPSVRSARPEARFLLLTDLADKQAEALAAGVDGSFGKSRIGDPEATARLQRLLYGET